MSLFENYKSNITEDIEDTVHTLGLDIPFFTEYQRNGFVYRAHRFYRSKNQYYDWAFVRWYDGEDLITNEPKFVSIIGRILTFILHPDGGIRAVVHSCNYTSRLPQGVFGTFYELEYEGPVTAKRPKLHLVEVDCLEDYACMIPYSSLHPLLWVHIWDRDKWPGCFQTIEAPQ